MVSLDEEDRITAWSAVIVNNTGSAHVHLANPQDERALAAARRVFEPLVGRPGSGVARLFTADEVRARGGDPTVAFALAPEEGFVFGSGYAGAAYETSENPGHHGFDSERPDMQAAMLVFGPPVVPGPIPDAALIDVGPSIASWLGLALPDVQGRARIELVRR